MLNCRADVNNLSFDFKLNLPQLNFTGKYALKIKILLLDISGKGNVRGVLSETLFNDLIKFYCDLFLIFL